MANGPVVAFIGSRNFDNNLSITGADVIRPEAASTPAAYAQDNTEYEVQVGSWVVNKGNLDNNAILNAKITTSGGTTLYDQSTASTPILAGDSAYFSFLHLVKHLIVLICIILLILLIPQAMNFKVIISFLKIFI